jgi:hypothetical protein
MLQIHFGELIDRENKRYTHQRLSVRQSNSSIAGIVCRFQLAIAPSTNRRISDRIPGMLVAVVPSWNEGLFQNESPGQMPKRPVDVINDPLSGKLADELPLFFTSTANSVTFSQNGGKP